MIPDLLSRPLKKKSRAVAVIMAGGSGTRFWPLSRANRPKQYLPLTEEGSSLIQATSERLSQLGDDVDVLVVTAANHAPLVREQLPKASVLLEPTPRNTAPCIGLAAIIAQEAAGDVPMLCLPADHLIQGDAAFAAALETGLRVAASEDALVTFGVPPTYPETGYGYIRTVREPRSNSETPKVYDAEAFVEKPTLEKAEEYLKAGTYCWNSGMFAWRPSIILREIERLLPKLAAGLETLRPIVRSGKAPEQFKEIFSSLESVSIDFGVMEKARTVRVVRAEGFRWSDIGSWSSWLDTQLAGKGEGENVTVGDVQLFASKGSAIFSQKRFVAGIGLEDVIVVETEDAILVCKRSHAQEVRQVVEYLKASKRNELL